MTFVFREPTLVEILSDPITQALMRADSVDRRQFEDMLREIVKLRSGTHNRGPEEAPTIAPSLPADEGIRFVDS